MRRVARTWVLVSVVASLLVGPGIALGADPPKEVHPRSHPARTERVGPVHSISAGAAIQAAPTGTVDYVSGGWWIDSSGHLNMVGEVYNGMSSRRQYVEIIATIKDSGGNVVGTSSGYAYIDQLAPGMTSPFYSSISAPPGAASVSVVVDPGSSVTAVPQGALRVNLGTPYTDSYGWRHYPGTVDNLAAFPVEFAQVVLTFYDGSGSVIDTDWNYAALDTIPAGGSSAFDVVLYGGDPGAVRVAAAAQARREGVYSTYVTSWNNYFNDIGSSAFRSDIVWIAEAGITTGCGAGLFCPVVTVPRDQMASFLARALHLSGSAPDAFTDDAGNAHEPNINLVAREGIASGCGGGKFCPATMVARDQMASFLARARGLSGAAPDAFTDDNGNLHETNINLVAKAGITTGCGGGKYCPSALVARDQMAAFLRRAFGSH
jgi:hypothetical protein